MHSDSVLDSVRQQISQRVAELRRAIARDQASLEELRLRSGSHDVFDAGERAGDVALAEVQEPTELILLREALQLEAALHRIAAGNYGICADCGQPIGAARLKAEPASTRCLSCQQALDSAGTRL